MEGYLFNVRSQSFKKSGGRVKRIFRDFLEKDRGSSSIEYAILGSLIAAVIALSVSQLGAAVKSMYESVIGKF
jgi:pilus assembly protein Flp/PilA